MKRIVPAEAPDLFTQIGKLPAQRLAVSMDRRHCDVLLANYFAHKGAIAPEDLPRTSLGGSLGLSWSYVSGLIFGWDGVGKEDLWEPKRIDWPEWDRGHADGTAAWAACVAAEMTEAPAAKAATKPAPVRIAKRCQD